MNASFDNVSCYDNEVTLIKSELNTTSSDALYYSTCLFIICLSIIFPFYVYLNKVNKSRDESVSIFPVTNHVYKIVKVTYSMFISSYIIFWFGCNLYESYVWSVTLLIGLILCLMILHIITQVTQFIISLLAIRKFIIYFFPSSIQTVIQVQGYLFCNSWMFYALFSLKELCGYIFMFLDFESCERDISFQEISYLAFNTFHIVSALLYVVISIRMKQRKTESMKKNKQQRLIAWQTMIIMIFKLLAVLLGFSFYYFDDAKIGIILLSLYVFDATSTPLIVQISYLFNNRKGLKKLLFNFKFANFIRVLMNIEVKSNVEPAGVIIIEMDQRKGSRGDDGTGNDCAVGAVSGS